jgi:SAM-dependent methyltransferase
MTLRTEHRTPGKMGFGVGIGVFVGCSPLWGIHFPLCVILATIFRLNRMIVYAAAYVGNPLTAGPILFGEIQLGHRILHGAWLSVTLADVKTLGVLGIFTNLLVGSVVLGVALGAVLGGASWLVARAGGHHETYHEIVDAVVVRYVDASIRDAEAARSRLLSDPMYPFLIAEGVLGSQLRVLDLGCGRGLVGVLVGLFTPASSPRWYLGVDRCDRYVRAAQQALEEVPDCAVQTVDLRDFDPPSADVVVINDVLRFLPFASQDALLRRLARALPPGARIFVRERDAAGGWRFLWAGFVDALKIVIPGHPRHGTHYRRAGDLRNALIAAGFNVKDRVVARAASPAFVLLEAVRRPAGVGRA